MGLEHYKVKSLKSVVERDLPNLQKTIRLRIQKAIKERLTVDPINLGEPLHHNLKGHIVFPKVNDKDIIRYLSYNGI